MNERREPLPTLLVACALALGTAVSLGLARFSYAMFLPPMREDLAWSYLTAGAMNTANAAGYLAGALLAPAWLRTFGTSPSRFRHLRVLIAAEGGQTLLGWRVRRKSGPCQGPNLQFRWRASSRIGSSARSRGGNWQAPGYRRLRFAPGSGSAGSIAFSPASSPGAVRT